MSNELVLTKLVSTEWTGTMFTELSSKLDKIEYAESPMKNELLLLWVINVDEVHVELTECQGSVELSDCIDRVLEYHPS